MNVITSLDEPVTWVAVAECDGHPLGGRHQLHYSTGGANDEKAALQRRYSNHRVRVVRRTVEWTEETT